MMSAIGPIVQNGFVVRDWREAANHWATQLGVGPFFVLEHVEFDVCRYKGEVVNPDISVAIAYTGGYQIELVQQHDATASIYTEFLAHNEPGLQHVGTLVDDLDAALDDNDLRGRIVQDGRTTAGQRFAYVDTVLHNGTMVELIEADDAMRKAFAYMQRAAQTWDGSEPIRG